MKKLTNKDAILFLLAVLGVIFYFMTIAETGLMGLVGTIVFVASGYYLVQFYQKYKYLD